MGIQNIVYRLLDGEKIVCQDWGVAELATGLLMKRPGVSRSFQGAAAHVL
jgi:hypothetical protein